MHGRTRQDRRCWVDQGFGDQKGVLEDEDANAAVSIARMLWMGWSRGAASGGTGGGMLGPAGLSIGLERGGLKKLAVLPRGPGAS